MDGHIWIIGCGIEKSDIPEKYVETILKADILAGGRRLLNWFPDHLGNKISFTAKIAEETTFLLNQADNKKVVILASGDPLFFGIAKRFISLCESDTLTIVPNITAVQSACARLKIPWASAKLFTVHGRNSLLAWRKVLQAPLSCIYGDNRRTPNVIAKLLIKKHPKSSMLKAYIVEELGNNHEKITEGTLEELSKVECHGLSMLIIENRENSKQISSPKLSLGCLDEEYEHENNLITHPEIRAIVLSKLNLGPGILWDLGAGSGSISIEACGLLQNLISYAIEKKENRCLHIEQNKINHGVENVNIIRGDILCEISKLKAPRSIFIGGGGKNITEIIEKAFTRLLPYGRMVISAVLLETKARIENLLPKYRIETLEIEIKRDYPVGKGRMLRADNPVTLYVYEGKK